MELNDQLVKFSASNITKIAEKVHVKPNVNIFHGNCFTLKFGRDYDCVYVGAACPVDVCSFTFELCLILFLKKLAILLPLIRDGGRMLVPLEEPGKENQTFTIVQRSGSSYTRKSNIIRLIYSTPLLYLLSSLYQILHL